MKLPKLRWIARQYAVDISINGRQRRFYLGRVKKDAEREHKELIATHVFRPANASPTQAPTIRTKESSGDENLSLRQLTQEFLEHVNANNPTSTYKFYEGLLGKFLDEHLNLMADDVSPLLLEKYKRQMQRRYKPRTVNAHLAAIKRMFNWAVDFELIEEHKLRRVEKVSEGSGKKKTLSPAQKKKLREHAGDDMRDIIELLMLTGMRPCELGNMSWEDVDWKNKQIVLYEHKTANTAKESKPRIIPITPAIAAILKPRKEDKGIVFPRPDRKRHNKDSLGKRFARIAKAAGLKGVTLYTLRHTFGTEVASKKDLKTVAELMGHTTTKTTEKYVHPVPSHVRDAMRHAEAGVLDDDDAAQD
ncbi:MAG: tyrosine-type recombinase/integrase [Planctomycetes bacterium]|nr:tyrosine-type recombinase/integrase [Planctomycetota bacterium]